MNSIFTGQASNSQTIDSLTVIATIENIKWAGTGTSIYISLGPTLQLQRFCETASAGETIALSIDLNKMFGRKNITLLEIQGISFHQVGRETSFGADFLNGLTLGVAGTIKSNEDDWALESVTLIANDIYSNTTFKHINKWLHAPSSHLDTVWSGQVLYTNWINSDKKPIDLNSQTYPVRWMPYIGDIMRWRSYDPSKIPGVGQLIGRLNGRLIGHQLSSGQSEKLESNTTTSSYTWVYTPEGSLIYRRWDKTNHAAYIRHSQLGSGRPVICAGEFKVIDQQLQSVISMVNDASGHYEPDGGACLRYVAEKFEALGISTEHTEWKWRDSAS